MDALDRRSLDRAMEGAEPAYYLIHSTERASKFEARDRIAARNFADAACAVGVRRIVYLRGLGSDARLSPHLSSRQESGRSSDHPAYRRSSSAPKS
jgi:uncharacterized protein YbjT (DUF2867 family)